MGNLLSYCALEEIDSCPMEGFLPEEYDKLLALQEMGLTSVLVLPVGYRAKNDPFSKMEKVRKNVEESIIEIF
jgi:nitroreductase